MVDELQEFQMSDMVKISKEELKHIIDANAEAYQELDKVMEELKGIIHDDYMSHLSKAYSALENAPADLGDLRTMEEIDEDDVDDEVKFGGKDEDSD